MSELRCVVIDTSTLIGAVLRPASTPRQALLVAAKGFELRCICDAMSLVLLSFMSFTAAKRSKKAIFRH